MTASLVTGVAHGAVVLNSNGSFTYTPDGNYNGPDSFTYRASDGMAPGNTATVSLSVAAVNDPTAVQNDAVTVLKNSGATTINVLANDTDPDGPLTITAVTQPANGTVSIINGGNAITYTPASNFTGTNTFTYTVAQGGQNTSGNVVVQVKPPDPTVVGTIDVGVRPNEVVASPDGHHVWVASRYDGAIKVVDTDTNSVVQTIPISSPQHMVFAPDGTRAYVLNGTDQVVVFNTANYSTVNSYTIPNLTSQPAFTNNLSISPDGQRLYADMAYQTNRTAEINVFNPNTGALIASYPGLYNTSNLQVSRDGTRLYLTGNAPQGFAQTLLALDTANGAVLHTVPLPVSAGSGSFRDTTVAVSKDGQRLLVAHSYRETEDGPFIAKLYVYDTSSMTVVKTIDIPSTGQINGIGDIAVTPSGDRFFIGNTAGHVIVLSGTDFSDIGTVSGIDPMGDYTISADGTRLYAAQTNTGSGSNLLRVVAL